MKKFFRYLFNWIEDPQNLISIAGIFLMGFFAIYYEFHTHWLLLIAIIAFLIFFITLFVAGIMTVKQEHFQFANAHFHGKSGIIWGVFLMIFSSLSFIFFMSVLIDLLNRPSN